jgi:hypothetical protein
MKPRLAAASVEPDSGEWGNMFPLVCEATGARQSGASPSYQGCRTGTRFWRGWAARSVSGEHAVFIRVYGPRRTERGWAGWLPHGARTLSAEILRAVSALSEDQPVVQAPWSAVVKGRLEYFSLTADEARVLAGRLEELAGEAEARAGQEERAQWQRCAAFDVPGLWDDGMPLPLHLLADPDPLAGEPDLAADAPRDPRRVRISG